MKSNFKILCSSVIFGALVTGCGVIDNQFNDDSFYQQKASVALNTKASNLVASNITPSLDSVKFDVEKIDSKEIYQCYYTTALVASSDVICNPISEHTNTKIVPESTCNALLKAANQC